MSERQTLALGSQYAAFRDMEGDHTELRTPASAASSLASPPRREIRCFFCMPTSIGSGPNGNDGSVDSIRRWRQRLTAIVTESVTT